jgi:hypothetical protein
MCGGTSAALVTKIAPTAQTKSIADFIMRKMRDPGSRATAVQGPWLFGVLFWFGDSFMEESAAQVARNSIRNGCRPSLLDESRHHIRDIR